MTTRQFYYLTVIADLGNLSAAARFGIQPFNRLGDPGGAFWVIVFLKIWQFGSPMVIFLAALKGVSKDLYEAASIDGAGKWRQFFSVTIPLITPVIFYNFVTQLCNKFQEFNGPFIVTLKGIVIYQKRYQCSGTKRSSLSYDKRTIEFLELVAQLGILF